MRNAVDSLSFKRVRPALSVPPSSPATWIPSPNHLEFSVPPPSPATCPSPPAPATCPGGFGLPPPLYNHKGLRYISSQVTSPSIFQSQTMKPLLCQANPQSLCSLLPPNSYPLVQSRSFKPSKTKIRQGWSLVQWRERHNGLAVGCANWSLEPELQRELEAEMKQREGEGEEIGMARFRHKCEEEKGLVEMLECLEREAIMGEDVGKEPSDYNRRAQIFDKSSRVIQALRQHDSSSVSPQHSSE